MKRALEVISLLRSFVFKPLASNLLWQRRLPISGGRGDAAERLLAGCTPASRRATGTPAASPGDSAYCHLQPGRTQDLVLLPGPKVRILIRLQLQLSDGETQTWLLEEAVLSSQSDAGCQVEHWGNRKWRR